MAADWYFDDLLPGHSFTTPGVTVSEAQILDFARVYDPQPFHIDSEAARDTEFGGLIASGFHTLSLSFAQFFRLEVFAKANLGSPGMEDLRWLKPLRPGDTIRVEAEVMEVKPSQSKPDRGIVVMRHDTFNQRGELILTVTCLHRLKRRGK
ncbi:MaoC family dehydratase [Ferrovibrio sp. MS7]|uniref:MaoC family dehydratase n=1 Tax=Ferrovibrio plantarum TaxID=3119164 RepID=UPI003134CB7F